MAKFSTTHDSDTGITYLIVEGSIQAKEWIGFMQTDGFKNRSDMILCDLTRASLIEIPTPDVLKLAGSVQPFLRDGVRAAYVLREGADFGIARMFKAHFEQMQYAVQLEAFTEREEAMRWLLTGDGPFS